MLHEFDKAMLKASSGRYVRVADDFDGDELHVIIVDGINCEQELKMFIQSSSFDTFSHGNVYRTMMKSCNSEFRDEFISSTLMLHDYMWSTSCSIFETYDELYFTPLDVR